MSGRSTLGLTGIGACALGSVMSLGAFAFYPYPAGSNPGSGELEILFLAMFFTGELIGFLGLGILIYLGILRRQHGRTSEP